MKITDHPIMKSLRSEDKFMREYDDDAMKSCRQCGGNDGFLYSARPLPGWYCGSCYHGLEEDARDSKMEEERK